MKKGWPVIAVGSPKVIARTADEVPTAIRALEAPVSVPWVGFFSYDLGRAFEELPSIARADRDLPLLACLHATELPDKRLLRKEIDRRDGRPSAKDIRCTFSRRDYLSAVQRCLDYIAAGDVFQINLAQRFTVPVHEPASEIYRRLQHAHGAVYPAFLDFGDYQIISNSPELFLRVTQLPDGRRKIVSRPIKGTRPNRDGMFAELVKSEKDKAELAMIVDLQRNDLGRVCEIGSVRVSVPRMIETTHTVIHGVATIEGILREDATLHDIFRAAFPCGSITGCPKIRAMQIIDELERVRRGVYCGAIGWIDEAGNMEFSVAIRTMLIKDGFADISVGGGIVADSVPEMEYEETLIKAQAMLTALGVSVEDVRRASETA